jgi:predicted sulfurtransferase
MLLATFREAPTTMIERFGELIEYRSDALRKHAKKWIAAYRTGSVL